MNRRRQIRHTQVQGTEIMPPTHDSSRLSDAAAAALSVAIEHHRAGRLRQARAGYRDILKAHPEHVDALHLLGVVMNQAGRNEAAVELIGRAVALKPEFAEAHSNLGNALRDLGRLDEAVTSFRQSVALRPDYAESHYNLGVALTRLGQIADAARAFQQAIALKPDFAEAHNNLGHAFAVEGRFEKAVACYRKAIAVRPDYAEAHYNLGNALTGEAKLDEAVACYRKAIELRPSYGEAHSNLGNALMGQGRFAEAVSAYQKAVALKPTFGEAHSTLGGALLKRGDLEAAIASCERAIALDPNLVEAHCNIGHAYLRLGKAVEAIASYRKAVALDPGSAQARYSLGLALADQGKVEEAGAAYRDAIARKPDFAEAHTQLGNVLRRQGKLDEAAVCHRKAIALEPDFAEAHKNLGVVLSKQNKLGEAVASCRKAISLKPDLVEAYYRLGVALTELGSLDEAIENYKQVIALRPDYAEAHFQWGAALVSQGNIAEAVSAFHRALDAKPEYVAAYYHLSTVSAYSFDDAEFAAMQRLVTEFTAVDEQSAQLFIALGKGYENRGDYDKAFDCFVRGNRLMRREIDFDAAAMERFFGQIAECFGEALFSRFEGAGSDSDLPIFIVGMPRSGTTLVEQMVASHPNVHGAGELADIGQIVRSLPQHAGSSERFPKCVAKVQFDLWRELGEKYVAGLRSRAPSRIRVTDKSMEHFRYIGLIRLMLPNARLIHCRRDAADTCLSIYKTLFNKAKGPKYCYDLMELGRYYRLYDRLMQHWSEVLPGTVLEVQYEDVVADVEGSARRIVDYCGLDWSDECLDFHRAGRPVRTASASQVRRPIYTDAIGRWRRYERHLGPLIRALGPCAPFPAATSDQVG